MKLSCRGCLRWVGNRIQRVYCYRSPLSEASSISSICILGMHNTSLPLSLGQGSRESGPGMPRQRDVLKQLSNRWPTCGAASPGR